MQLWVVLPVIIDEFDGDSLVPAHSCRHPPYVLPWGIIRPECKVQPAAVFVEQFLPAARETACARACVCVCL